MMALVEQFTNTDYDVLLYDPQSSKNRRGEFVANLVKESGAQGLVLFMQQFCDPEEMEFPYLKKALDAAGIPFIKLGVGCVSALPRLSALHRAGHLPSVLYRRAVCGRASGRHIHFSPVRSCGVRAGRDDL